MFSFPSTASDGIERGCALHAYRGDSLVAPNLFWNRYGAYVGPSVCPTVSRVLRGDRRYWCSTRWGEP